MARQDFLSPDSLKILRESLCRRKSMIDFETLGRTLAYSPFLPRVDREFFARDETEKQAEPMGMESAPSVSHSQPKIACCLSIEPLAFAQSPESHLFESSKLENEQEFESYVLDLCGMFAQNFSARETKNGGGELGAGQVSLDSQINILESISLLRRHSTLPIIHADVFFEEYQILESALFGSDALLLPAGVSSAKELSIMLNFARRVSLESFVYVRDSVELKKAIFSGASMLFIPESSLENLLPLVPNTQIIASDSMQEYGVDVHIRLRSTLS